MAYGLNNSGGSGRKS